jgi:hypothetical protein
MSTSLDQYRDDPESIIKFNQRRRDLFKTSRSAALDIAKGRSGRVFMKWPAKTRLPWAIRMPQLIS